MKHIGLTGGIGSGKSTVAALFEAQGFQVYYADTRAKAIQEEDPQVRDAIIQLLGPASYTPAGLPDRAHISGIVFQDRAKLAALNAIIHPAVARDHQRWVEAIPASYPHPFVLKEAAILFEAGTAAACDAVLMVYAPKALRLARVAARDGVDIAQVRSRMANQWPDQRKLLLSDFIIFNDGIHALPPQVAAATQHFSR